MTSDWANVSDNGLRQGRPGNLNNEIVPTSQPGKIVAAITLVIRLIAASGSPLADAHLHPLTHEKQIEPQRNNVT